MKIATKTVASLLLVTAVAAAVPGISKISGGKRRHESQFDRLLQRHDRKGDLRATILGIEPARLRALLKTMPLEEVVRESGFASTRAFRLALFGKLKNELRQRGWTSQRIEQYVLVRSARLG
ncbi:MAG TPA: hypothetical protein VK502_02140 [Candidatus Saccharimonadales bacterium]|nr:hypothetical protein [Candidatus Saccharimonadales bacterium]